MALPTISQPFARLAKSSFESRFWSKVEIKSESECWLWTAYRDRKGYGHFYLAGSDVRAHIVAYKLAHEDFEKGKHVLHRCDNPPCCNPSHLCLGTNAENVADKMRKGRYRCLSGENHANHLRPERLARGERNGASKLDWRAVNRIRALYNARVASQRELAAMFGVGQNAVGKIVRNETWKSEDTCARR